MTNSSLAAGLILEDNPFISAATFLCIALGSFAEVAVVAEVAFPDKLAVIVPAEKLPDASLATIVDAVLDDAVVIALAILAIQEDLRAYCSFKKYDVAKYF